MLLETPHDTRSIRMPTMIRQDPGSDSQRSTPTPHYTAAATTDESLLASALLEIRSDTRGQVTAPNSPTTGNTATTASNIMTFHNGPQPLPAASTPPKKRRVPPKKTKPHIPNNNLAIAPNHLALPQSAPAIAPAPTLSYAPNMGNIGVFSPEQLAALQVAAAASAATFAATASAAANPLNHHANLIHQQAAAFSAPTLSSVPPACPQPPQVPAPVPAQTISPKSTHAADLNDGESVGGRAFVDNIRMEQVEAALKSKPQRGRKREDLSELERLELTRTRNREHAKSTRIRKKARHQELLDIEKRCEELENKSNLLEDRRKVVGEFLKSRELMFHNFQPSDSSHSSGENTAPASNKTFTTSSWEDLVESTTDFDFTDGVTKGDTVHLSGSDKMRRFDEHVYSNVMAKFGDSTLMRLLRYQIKGQENGIALDFADGGMAEVELALDLPSKVTLMTGVWRFWFGKQSEKIRSVTHIQTMSRLTLPMDRLLGQTSYPSTVSLEPIVQTCDSFPKSSGEPKPDHDSTYGPGMNI